MTTSLAVILGGAAGAVGLVALLVFLWFCLLHKSSVSRTSETGSSSDPSLQAGHGIELSLLRGGPPPSNSREARHFMLDELNLATKNFSNINLIGEGKFGEVYKGLINDGMIVAIKKRPGAPNQELVEEVRYLSSIRHRNIVMLLGYCQENNQQMLVYEYIPNGSVSSHLYGAGQVSSERLEFKHRLSVALGAAKGSLSANVLQLFGGFVFLLAFGRFGVKGMLDASVTKVMKQGLEHLHALNPPLLHKDFKTRNVLVDENFIAKVADAGLTNLLGRIDAAGPSSRIMADDVFLDPEFIEFGRFSEKSDVYSFGVFLLELVSGQEALKLQFSESNQSMVEWVQNYQDTSNIATIIDPRLSSSFTAESMKELIWLTAHCVNPSSERRPAMNYVVLELDRILEKEMNLTMVMGEGTPIVTLGSQLFTASR